MNGGSLAPGLIKGGDIDINFIHDSWTEDLIPDLDGLELNSSEQALPVFQPMPFFIYKARHLPLQALHYVLHRILNQLSYFSFLSLCSLLLL